MEHRYCPNGSIGCADFVGFRKENKNDCFTESKEIQIKKNLFTIIRLWRIEYALRVKLYKWQRDYIFSQSWKLPESKMGRANGKTMAVNIKILMFYRGIHFVQPHWDEFNPLLYDPDFNINKQWHIHNLRRDWEKCKKHKIEVFKGAPKNNNGR